jgi:hypothetical protein
MENGGVNPRHSTKPRRRALGGVLYAMLDKFLLCVVVLVLVRLVAIAIICVPHFQDWLLRRI